MNLVVLLIIFSVIVVVAIEIPRLLKENKRKEIVIFLLLLFPGFVHALLQGMGMEVSSNIEAVTKLVGLIKDIIRGLV